MQEHRDGIKAIVARHQRQFVAMFGSVTRGDERPGNDTHLIVELVPGTHPFERPALALKSLFQPDSRSGEQRYIGQSGQCVLVTCTK